MSGYHVVAAEDEIARLKRLIIGLVRGLGKIGPEDYLSAVVGNDPESEGWPKATLKEEQISFNRTRLTVVPEMQEYQLRYRGTLNYSTQ